MKAREAPGRFMVAEVENLVAHLSEVGAWAGRLARPGTEDEARHVCSGLSGDPLPASGLCLVCIAIQGPWPELAFPALFFFFFLKTFKFCVKLLDLQKLQR